MVQSLLQQFMGGGAAQQPGKLPAGGGDPFGLNQAPTGAQPALPGAPAINPRAGSFMGANPSAPAPATAGAKPAPSIGSQFAGGVAAKNQAFVAADQGLSSELYQAGAKEPRMLAEDKQHIVDAVEAGDAEALKQILMARPSYRTAVANYARARQQALQTSPLANTLQGP
jgi:hypothetical protein